MTMSGLGQVFGSKTWRLGFQILMTAPEPVLRPRLRLKRPWCLEAQSEFWRVGGQLGLAKWWFQWFETRKFSTKPKSLKATETCGACHVLPPSIAKGGDQGPRGPICRVAEGAQVLTMGKAHRCRRFWMILDPI